MYAPIPDNEAERLAVLRSLDILDTEPESAFDELAQLAAFICEVPIALVTLVDEDRQWFKSLIGLDDTETPRDISFCAHTIMRPEPLIIVDAAADSRFSDNPLVAGGPQIRFYAGVPVLTGDGYAMGSLSVADRVPRSLSDRQIDSLRVLGNQVSRLLDLRTSINAQKRLIDSLVESEAGRSESEQLLRAAIDSMHEGFVLNEGPKGVTLSNKAATRILGMEVDDLTGRTSLDPSWRNIHEDGTPFDSEDHPTAITLRTGQPVTGVIMGIAKPSGETVWLSINSSPMFKLGYSKPHAAVVTFADITASRYLLHSLKDSETRFRLLAENSSDMISRHSPDGVYTYVSPASLTLIGYDRDELVGKSAYGFIHPDDINTVEVSHNRILNNVVISTTQYRIRHRAGHYIWLETTSKQITDPDTGEVTEIHSATRDISDRKAAEEQAREYSAALEANKRELEESNAELESVNTRLHELATTDGLTSLDNHRAFQTRVHDEIVQRRAVGSHLALIAMDVDRFKSYNDSYGHPAGDEVLKAIAGVIKSLMRSSDQAARYGGEEFMMLLPNTPLTVALAVAERLRLAIEAAPIEHGPVTASFGVAVLTDESSKGYSLIARADAALYAAKHSGRNRVCAD